MNIEDWNFEEYQKKKEEYMKKKELEAKTDIYFVEYFLHGKMHALFISSLLPEEEVRKKIIDGFAEKWGVQEKNISITKQNKRYKEEAKK